MSLPRIAAKLTTVGVAGLLTTGALVGLSTAGASADDAPPTTIALPAVQYDCTSGGVSLPVTVSFVVPAALASLAATPLPAGENLVTLAGGSIPLGANFVISKQAEATIGALGAQVLGGDSTGKVALGSALGSVKLTVPSTPFAPAADGTQTLTATGALTSLVLAGQVTKPASEKLLLPTSLSSVIIPGFPAVPCKLHTKASANTGLALTVAPASVKAKATKSTIAVTAVDGAGQPGAGKVTATFTAKVKSKVKGKVKTTNKTVSVPATLKAGAAKINLAPKLKSLKLKSAKVTVNFAGATAKVTVKK